MSIKTTSRTAKRIIAMVESGNYDPDIIEHMLQSLVESRDRRIRHLEKKAKPREFVITPKAISGALRSCIRHHGPITKELVPSASKRLYGNFQRVIDELI
jgi:hypothetical protein